MYLKITCIFVYILRFTFLFNYHTSYIRLYISWLQKRIHFKISNGRLRVGENTIEIFLASVQIYVIWLNLYSKQHKMMMQIFFNPSQKQAKFCPSGKIFPVNGIHAICTFVSIILLMTQILLVHRKLPPALAL